MDLKVHPYITARLSGRHGVRPLLCHASRRCEKAICNNVNTPRVK